MIAKRNARKIYTHPNRFTTFEELWYPIPAGIILIFVRAHVMK